MYRTSTDFRFLPFAFLGFVSGKKKRESDRASMHGGK